jgi:hypothetical protein
MSLSLHELAEIATVVTGMGVVLVVIQIRQGARVSRVELLTSLTALIVALDELFIEYPEMWKYFNANASPPKENPTECERAEVIALAVANTFDHIVEHLDLMKRPVRRSWCRYIGEAYANSPVLRELLDKNREWWPGLQKQVRS